jgi:hypothetical protein
MPKLRSRIFDKFILNPTCEPLAKSDEPRVTSDQHQALSAIRVADLEIRIPNFLLKSAAGLHLSPYYDNT